MKITVLMPVYNAGSYLRQAVDSALGQESAEFELLVIDDGSTDGSREVLASYQPDPRVRLVLHEKNLGLAGTLNEGLRLAQGDYIARLDQDDEALPGRFRLQAEFLDRNPSVIVVGGQILNMGATPDLDRPVNLPLSTKEIRARLPKENCLYHPAVMFRRADVLAAGGYRAEFRNAEDYDLWLRISRQGDLVNLPDTVIRYRLTTSGMSYGRRWEQLRYVFLAQESHRDPTAPLEALWPAVEARLAKFDRVQFFDCVARHAVSELHALGFPAEAKRMLNGFHGELSNSSRSDLEQLLEPAKTPCALQKPAPAMHTSNSPRLAYSTSHGLIQSILAATVLLIPSVIWICRDQQVWPWDQAWYGEVSVDLWWALRHATQSWGHDMIAAFGIKAPGIAWLGQFFVPLGTKLGSIEHALMCMQLLASAATLILWFQIGTRLWRGDHRGGWLITIIGAGAPLFTGIIHQYVVEPQQILSITLIYWLALAGGELPKLRLISLTFLAATIAMAIKVTSPLSCILPGAIVIARFIHSKNKWRSNGCGGKIGDILITICAFSLLIPTVIWYLHNQKELREFIQFASSSESTLIYGNYPEFWAKWHFWLNAAQHAFFQPFFDIMLLVLIITALVLRAAIRSNSDDIASWWSRAVVFAAGGQIIIVLHFFTRQIPEETRYLMPLLPSVLIVIMALLGIGPRRFVTVTGIAIAICQWTWVNSITQGLSPANNLQSPWLLPVDSNVAHRRDLERIIMLTTTPATAYRYHINGYETPWLNANSLAFYAAKHRLEVGYRCYYTSLGYAASDFPAAWQRLEDLQTHGFISIAAEHQTQPPDFLNKIALPALNKIKTTSAFQAVPFDSQHHILLYLRLAKP